MKKRSAKQKIVLIAAVLGSILVLAAALTLKDWKPREPDIWRAYSESDLVKAKKAQKAVIMDFYADWCEPCHAMERHIFRKPRFREAAKSLVLLRVDATNPENREVRHLKSLYAIEGLPTVIFLGPDGRERSDLRVLGGSGDWNADLEKFLLFMELSKSGKHMPPAP